MAFKIASRKTTTLELGEGGQLTVKTDISKGDFNALLRAMPQDLDAEKGFTPVEADEFTIGLFNMFVTDWNAEDEEGNKVPATESNYLALQRESSSVIDSALIEHFNALTPNREERDKSEATVAATGPRPAKRQPDQE